MNDTENTWETAIFGKQIENFLSDDVGRYLVKSAEIKAEHAIEELKKISPFNIFNIYRLQHKIEFWEDVQQHLANAIIDGKQALAIIEGKDDV